MAAVSAQSQKSRVKQSAIYFEKQHGEKTSLDKPISHDIFSLGKSSVILQEALCCPFFSTYLIALVSEKTTPLIQQKTDPSGCRRKGLV